MTCDLAHERLLSDPADLGSASAELREHLAGCPACQAIPARANALDALIRRLPTADSTPAKAAFLASLHARSVTPSSLIPVDRSTRGRAYLTVAMLAASVLIAVGVMAMWPKPGQIVKRPTSPAPHALLSQSVAFLTEQSGRPEQRVLSSTQYAGSLVSELRGIYQAAGPDDVETVRILSDLTQRVLADGLAESRLPNHPAERKAILDPIMPRLAGLSEATRAMNLTAPLHHQPSLTKLQSVIDVTTNRLAALGGTPASPRDVPSPAGSNAGQQLALVRQNRSLIEIVADRSLKVAQADDAIAKMTELRLGSQAIETSLSEAVAQGDADRAGELSERLASVYSDGLAPALSAATIGHENPESPSYARVQEMKAKAKEDVQRVRALLPTSGPLGTHPRIESARKQLSDATGRLL